MRTDFLMRTLLYVPGHNEHKLLSAARSGADMLALDLEDSCLPVENKQIARDTIIRLVQKGAFKEIIGGVYPRVNDRESGELLKDIYQLSIEGISGFIYPKSKTAEDIYFIGKLLETVEYEKGFPIGTFKIIPLIETAGAVAHINDICTICPERVIAVGFGAEDYMTDLGGIHDAEGVSILTARSLIAVAAKAASIVPLDIVHMNVHDLKSLEREVLISKKLGYEGKMIVHPKEIAICHKHYSPSDEQVEWAKEMLRLSEEAIAEGKGVAVKDNKFIGPPMVKMAKCILRKKELIDGKQ